MKIYPKWLSYLTPFLTRANSPHDVQGNHYFLISGEGFPSLLDNHLINSVRDINNVNKFDYFVIILDAEELTVQQKIDQVIDFIAQKKVEINCDLKIIVQNRCIETWLLANRRMFPRQPQDVNLRQYIRFYNVRNSDPELSGVYPDFENHAHFHYEYLKLIFEARERHYTKRNPSDAMDQHFLDQLIERTNDMNDHIKTFQIFYNFCEELRVQYNSQSS